LDAVILQEESEKHDQGIGGWTDECLHNNTSSARENTRRIITDLKPSVAENRNRKTRQNFLQNVNINKFILLCE